MPTKPKAYDKIGKLLERYNLPKLANKAIENPQ